MVVHSVVMKCLLGWSVALIWIPLGLSLGSCGERATCKREAARGNWSQAIALCRDRYARLRDPEAGLQVARGLRRSGDLRGAMRMAQQLVHTRVGTEAYAVLGDAAQRADDRLTMREAWGAALKGYRATNNTSGVARAAHGLAGAYLASGELGAANHYMELAIAEATRLGDRQSMLYSQLGRADILRQRGSPLEAETAIAEAAPLLRTPEDRMWYALKRGILYGSMKQHTMARRDLLRALELAQESKELTDDVKLAVHLNLAWVDRVGGNVRGSLEHLAIAEKLPRVDPLDLHFHRGLALADDLQLAAAAAELELAQRALPQGQWSWAVPYHRGRVAAARGDAPGAVAAYRESMLAVQALTERAGSFTPDVASSHREPYQRLFGIYAARGEWTEAFQLVMELDLLSLISSEEAPAAGQLDKGLPDHPSPPVIPPLPPVAEVLEAWRGRHLVVLVSDEETLWRLEVKRGRVIGVELGPAGRLEDLARRLEATPADAALAARLGEAVLPSPARADSDDGVLDVLLIGAMGRTPLAALRRKGELALVRTPLARVLGVLPRARPAPSRSGAVVLGDPYGDLASARREAVEVAARLGVVPLIGSTATRTALAGAHGAHGAALLHVAAHSALTAGGPILSLADGSIGPAEISSGKRAAGVVVLASCGGAVARDAAGWGSLAAAFLKAGSDFVIAPGRSVDDGATLQLILALYRGDVAAAPVQALARAQVAMSASLPPEIWAAFAVLRAPPPLAAARPPR
jgi:tetratricopeptide (TPR) repeat protein